MNSSLTYACLYTAINYAKERNATQALRENRTSVLNAYEIGEISTYERDNLLNMIGEIKNGK